LAVPNDSHDQESWNHGVPPLYCPTSTCSE
jgi:hypothetical protein